MRCNGSRSVLKVSYHLLQTSMFFGGFPRFHFKLILRAGPFLVLPGTFLGYSGQLIFRCLDGNLTCPGCTCQLDGYPVPETGLEVPSNGPVSELPVAALAAAVTALVLLLCFAAGVLWHRAVKRKAMAAAVAAAVGDFREGREGGPTIHPVLPKSGTRSGHSVSHSTSAASSASKAKEDGFELVVDLPMELPLYWATKEGIHIFPDPNRIGEVQLRHGRTCFVFLKCVFVWKAH